MSAVTTSKIPATGTDYIYGERAVTLEEAEQLARRRQQMYDCQRETYAAETNCRSIVAGTTFSISGHPQDDCDGDYLVVSVQHYGNQSDAFAFGGAKTLAASGQTYHNELTLIKKDTPYRPPLDRKRIPLVCGVLPATIETTGGDYAYLDDQGRYRLNFWGRSSIEIAQRHSQEKSRAMPRKEWGSVPMLSCNLWCHEICWRIKR